MALIKYLFCPLFVIISLIISTNSVELKGNFVCGKIENYEISVNVSALRPFKEKKVEWCISKLRCTKEKIVQKTVYEIQKINKTRVVKECCDGYKQVDDHCEPICNPECGPNGICVATNICKCNAGFHGALCNIGYPISNLLPTTDKNDAAIEYKERELREEKEDDDTLEEHKTESEIEITITSPATNLETAQSNDKTSDYTPINLNTNQTYANHDFNSNPTIKDLEDDDDNDDVDNEYDDLSSQNTKNIDADMTTDTSILETDNSSKISRLNQTIAYPTKIQAVPSEKTTTEFILSEVHIRNDDSTTTIQTIPKLITSETTKTDVAYSNDEVYTMTIVPDLSVTESVLTEKYPDNELTTIKTDTKSTIMDRIVTTAITLRQTTTTVNDLNPTEITVQNFTTNVGNHTTIIIYHSVPTSQSTGASSNFPFSTANSSSPLNNEIVTVLIIIIASAVSVVFCAFIIIIVYHIKRTRKLKCQTAPLQPSNNDRRSYEPARYSMRLPAIMDCELPPTPTESVIDSNIEANLNPSEHFYGNTLSRTTTFKPMSQQTISPALREALESNYDRPPPIQYQTLSEFRSSTSPLPVENCQVATTDHLYDEIPINCNPRPYENATFCDDIATTKC